MCCCHRKNAGDCAQHEGEKENERWFDFESFGNDLLDDSRYYEISDGRIVLLSE